MKTILAILLIISINNSCGTKKNILIDVKNVTKIEIINKTKKNFIVNSISFSDKKNIGLLINQTNNLRLLDKEVNSKSNFGYFDISIMLNDGSVMGFDVLHTEYSGVVIVNIQNSERYRNDKLNDLIVVLFREYSLNF